MNTEKLAEIIDTISESDKFFISDIVRAINNNKREVLKTKKKDYQIEKKDIEEYEREKKNIYEIINALKDKIIKHGKRDEKIEVVEFIINLLESINNNINSTNYKEELIKIEKVLEMME